MIHGPRTTPTDSLFAGRVLVCGSRNFADPFRASLTIDSRINELDGEWDVIHGAARGADMIAAESALRRGHNVRAFPAKWDELGKRAGYVRNIEMLEENPSLVLAFWNGESKGTLHTLTEAKKRGISVEVVFT